jgi:hypothetical protein
MSRFSGACDRAANWILVGQTQGRGRQDRYSKRERTIKDIYVYPLEKDFRDRLGLAKGVGLGPRAPVDGVDGKNWAKQEFGEARLGDARLSERLVEIAQLKAEKPGCAFTGVAEGNWPAVKAYYRFMDHPDEEAVNMAHILEPHRKRTIQRMKAQRTVLCIQDGSDLDYTSLAECEGLDDIELQVLHAYAKKNTSNHQQRYQKRCDWSDALVDIWAANMTHHPAIN